MIRIAVMAGISIALVAPASAQRGSQTQAPKGPWMDASLSPDRRADLAIAEMTIDEKIRLVHGAGMPGFGPPPDPVIARSNGGAGFVPGVARLGIPDLNMADSAVGVARGAARGRYSTPMPSTLAEAATWDPKLAYAYGALIGRELRDQGYNTSLGGGVDLAREPRNGRNFEYQGEDPILAGRMVAQFIKGLQDQKIIGDIKHYALNDQETGRSYGDVHVDKRAMRETDLLAFEIGIKQSSPGMVMCSYNLVNGDYACENKYLLNDVLKKAWGFKGWVVSDWGATHTTAKAALAGLDQEQPGGAHFGNALERALEAGEVPRARLDDMVHRILRTEFASGIVDNPPIPKVVDVFGGLDVAQRVAEQSIVLLKNAGQVLPLNAKTVRSIAVIGSHADAGVISGGGSAQVDPPGGNAVPPPPAPISDAKNEFEAAIRIPVWQPSSPLRALRAKASGATVQYNAGTDTVSAASLAKGSDVAIVFVNQPSSEARDASLTLPDRQDQLVSAVAAANPRTIVVLETGGPVMMPWIEHVGAALEVWFPGLRGGEAIANVIFGDVNPSAKLPVTFPKSEVDLPHPRIPAPPVQRGPLDGVFETLPPFTIDYTEGLKVGYKWFDAEEKQPLFAFGYGLSYTTFAYSGLKASRRNVTFTLKNTGARTGAEIAQVYAALPANTNEPPKRLVAWEKVELAPGESKSVTLDLDPLYLSIFNAGKDDWELAPGTYRIFAGGSSRNTPLMTNVDFR